MTKEELLPRLKTIKSVIQMAYEGDLLGRLVDKADGGLALCFTEKQPCDVPCEDINPSVDLNIVMGADGKWSATKYGVIDYGTPTTDPQYGYYRIGGVYDFPEECAKDVVRLLT